MDREYAEGSSLENLVDKPPELVEGLRNQNDNLPELGRMQIDLLVNSFVNDFARVATLQYTKSVGQAKMNWLDIDDAHHTLSHEPDKNRVAYDKRPYQYLVCGGIGLLKKLETTPEPGQKDHAGSHAGHMDQRIGQRHNTRLITSLLYLPVMVLDFMGRRCPAIMPLIIASC